MSKMVTAQELIKRFHMHPHPEGGYYAEVYKSDIDIPKSVLPKRFNGARATATHIYFLLENGQHSAFHRIAADEMWHAYAGGPLELMMVDDRHKGEVRTETVRIGNSGSSDESFYWIVPAGVWFAARIPKEVDYSFVGCTVSPGFDFADFELRSQEEMIAAFPEQRSFIELLC